MVFVTFLVCLPECFVGFVIYPLLFSWSVSSSMRRILCHQIIGNDKTSYRSLSNCRSLSEGVKHLPQVRYRMPTSQDSGQSRHCTLDVISNISKYSVLRMMRISSFDFSLNRLKFLVLVQVCHQRLAIWVCFKLVDQFLDCFSANIAFFSERLSVADLVF